MNSQLSFDAMSLSPAHADHVTTGHGGHGPNHQHPHAAPTSSAAEPIALILLSVGALSLLQAFLRSFLSNRISLPSAEYQPLPTSEHAVSSIEEHERSVDPYLTSTVAAQPLLASDYEQEEEEKLAEAALGKAVELDDFRVRSRNKLAALALFATVNLAISAGQLAWIDSQGRLVEFLLRTGVNVSNSTFAALVSKEFKSHCFVYILIDLDDPRHLQAKQHLGMEPRRLAHSSVLPQLCHAAPHASRPTWFRHLP